MLCISPLFPWVPWLGYSSDRPDRKEYTVESMRITEELIRQIVLEVVDKIERLRKEAAVKESPLVETFSGKLLTASDVEFFRRNQVEILRISKTVVITPLAKERCSDLDLTLEGFSG
jgi:hypothetical protein